MLNKQEYILRSFSEGNIGWREACRRLNIQDFNELDDLLKAHNLCLYQANSRQYIAHNQAIDCLLYDDGAN